MLKRLKLHNFRTFLNTELEFTQRHLIIGQNNSGKTNLCKAMQFLAATASNGLTSAASVIPGGINEIKNWGVKDLQIELSCACELVFDGQPYDYSYALGFRVETSKAPGDRGQLFLRLVSEQLRISGPGFPNVLLLDNDGREAQMLHEEGYLRQDDNAIKTTLTYENTMLFKLYELETNRRAILFRTYLRSWGYYALSPTAMRYGWRDVDAGMPPTLTPGGDNLAVVLYHLKNMDEQRYRRTIEHTHIVEPTLEAINFNPAPDQPPVPYVARGDKPRASWGGLSDGTLRCLGIATVIETARELLGQAGRFMPLIIIEEPENGICPGQLRKVFNLFEEWAPEGQFMFTSHNPYFIDFFEGYRDSVTLLRRKGERTEIVSLPPPEKDPDRLTLSELYSLELIG